MPLLLRVYTEEEKAAVHMKKYCPATGKLNYNAPLLSTRRTIGFLNRNRLEEENTPNENSVGINCEDKFERVPFSWEQTPGKPKDMLQGDDHREDAEEGIPPPKPPPGCRSWLPIAPAEAKEEEEEADPLRLDCEGVGDGESWNGLDIFSLAQSVETVDTWEELRRKFGIENVVERDAGGRGDHVELEEAGIGGGGCHSPSFMIQRFLPDAKALAAAASSSASPNTTTTTLLEDIIRVNSDDHQENKKHPKSTSVSRAAIRTSSFSSTKGGCGGLDILFPWRVKLKPPKGPCGATTSPAAMALPTYKPRWK